MLIVVKRLKNTIREDMSLLPLTTAAQDPLCITSVVASFLWQQVLLWWMPSFRLRKGNKQNYTINGGLYWNLA